MEGLPLLGVEPGASADSHGRRALLDNGVALAHGADGGVLPDLEHALVSPHIQARLAQVVRRLRGSWLAGPALLWHDIHPIGEDAATEVDERIARALVDGFFEFSQFLAGFEVLLLELEHFGVVSEECLLGVEQHIVQRSGLLSDRGGVSDADKRPGHVDGSADGG